MTGADLIAAERERQVKAEGWTPEHDDGHISGELALAAAVYATPTRDRDDYGDFGHPSDWPWPDDDPKFTPDDRVRELVKAGALIAAEIDRLLRREAHRD